MGVDLYLEDERGGRLAELLDPSGYVMYLVGLVAAGPTPCLQFVDPYGMTVFNRLQVPVVILELEALRDLVPDASSSKPAQHSSGTVWQNVAAERNLFVSGSRVHLEQMLGMARRCQADVHTYLKFDGD